MFQDPMTLLFRNLAHCLTKGNPINSFDRMFEPMLPIVLRKVAQHEFRQPFVEVAHDHARGKYQFPTSKIRASHFEPIAWKLRRFLQEKCRLCIYPTIQQSQKV